MKTDMDNPMKTVKPTKKKLQVTFSNGDTFQIPAHNIAHARADYYARRDEEKGDGKYDEIYPEEYLFSCSNSELLDWAANNCNFSDFKDVAVKIKNIKDFSHEKEWCNADIKIKRE